MELGTEKALSQTRIFIDQFDMFRWITMRVMGLHYSHGMEKAEAQMTRQTQLAKDDVITGSANELARSSS